MGKLYSYTYMTLDGVIESPEKWTAPFFGEELGEDLATRLESAAAMVLGRVTYSEFADFWPRQSDDVPFTTLNNTVRKYVVSRTLKEATWQNTSVFNDDVSRLKEITDGDLHISGSGTLIRNWIQEGAVDEVVLVVFPVVVGAGKRFHEGGTQLELTLTDWRQFPKGVTRLIYRPPNST